MIHKLLAGLLLAQLGLAAVTWWPDRDALEPTPLVALGEGGPDRLVLVGRTTPDAPADEVVLKKTEAGWVSETHFDHPVQEGALDEVLDLLGASEITAPIVTRAVHHASLEVADDTFLRKVGWARAGATGTLYLGAATGNASYVRRGGEDEVFRLRGVRAGSLPEGPTRLFDRALLDVEVGEVTGLRLVRGGEERVVAVRADDGSWSSPRVPMPLQKAEVEALVRKVTGLRVEAPIAGSAQPEHGLDDLVVELTVAGEEDSRTVVLRVGAPVDGGSDRAVQIDDRRWVYRARPYAVDALLDATLDSLVQLP